MPMACETWPIDPSCLPSDWAEDPAQWDVEQTASLEAASAIMRRFTAGVYGLCTLKVRPCRPACVQCYRSRYYGVDVPSASPWRPMLVDGSIYNTGCGCAGECGCSPLHEIILEPYAYDVVGVRIDGLVISPLTYRVDGYRRLVRTDGSPWPDCQELVRPDTEPDTFSVTYRTGAPVPPDGRRAVTELTVELHKARCGNTAGCKLPRAVTEVVREGMSYTVLNSLEMFERGRTGLTNVDMFLAAVNPYSARQPMAAWSPDTIRSRRQTGGIATIDPPPPGVAGTGYYHWFQDIAVTSLMIDHELGYRPSGVELYSADWQVRYENFGLIHIDENRLTITTEIPFRGHVILG